MARRSRPPSRRSLLLVVVLSACTADDLQPSLWPPSDFEVAVEELQVENGEARVVRRLQVNADGVVVYATSTRSVVDATTRLALPVFDRLAIYRLVPTCVRALARRLYRTGITDLDPLQGEPSDSGGGTIGLVWRAFGQKKSLSARGRVHGPMAEILGTLVAHLPDGETFAAAGLAERPTMSVLRGVPAPRADGPAALQAQRALAAERPGDTRLLLDAYALACDLRERDVAVDLLQRWREAAAALPRTGAFTDAARLDAAALARLLPLP